MTALTPVLAAMVERINIRLSALSFRDDATSMRAALASALGIIHDELEPLRHSAEAHMACQQICEALLKNIMARRERTGMTVAECDALRSRAMPWLH